VAAPIWYQSALTVRWYRRMYWLSLAITAVIAFAAGVVVGLVL
jgi:hypothetical protein